MPDPEIRKGMPSVKLTREEFSQERCPGMCCCCFEAINKVPKVVIGRSPIALSIASSPNLSRATTAAPRRSINHPLVRVGASLQSNFPEAT
jgi:hypothetical protein